MFTNSKSTNMDNWLSQRFGELQIVANAADALTKNLPRLAFLTPNDEPATIALVRQSMADAGYMHLATIPAAVAPGAPAATGSMLVFEKRPAGAPPAFEPKWDALLAAAPCDYYKRLAEQFSTPPAAPWYLTSDQIDAMEAARLLALVDGNYDIFVAIEEQGFKGEARRSLIEAQPLSQQAGQWLLKTVTPKSAAIMVRFWSRTMIQKLAFEFEQEWILPAGFDAASEPVIAHVHVVRRGLCETHLKSWNERGNHTGLIFMCITGAGMALPSFFHATHHTALMYQDLPRFKELHATRLPHAWTGGGYDRDKPAAPHDLPLVSQLLPVATLLKPVAPLHKLSVLFIGSVVLEIIGHTVGMDADMVAWNPAGHADIASLKMAPLPDLDLALWNGREYVGADAYVTDWYNREWPALFGAPNMEEVVYNPRYHLYWRGMKMMSLSGTVARLKQRARPAAMADLYALKHKLGLPIELPMCLPPKVIVGGETRFYTDPKTLERTYQTTIRNLRTWQDMNVSMDEIRRAFPPCGAVAAGGASRKTRKHNHNRAATRKAGKNHWIVTN